MRHCRLRQRKLCKCLFGIERFSAGDLLIDNRKLLLRSPAEAFECGIGFVPEDRRNEGIILNMSVADNITLPVLRSMKKNLLVQKSKQSRISSQMIEKFNIKIRTADDACAKLSGGNQQKVILAKWLLSRVKVIIFSHPTREWMLARNMRSMPSFGSLPKMGKPSL